MPNGTGLPPNVENGEVCARCGVQFDGAHGTPVLCHHCHTEGNPQMGRSLPKAWLEEAIPPQRPRSTDYPGTTKLDDLKNHARDA